MPASSLTAGLIKPYQLKGKVPSFERKLNHPWRLGCNTSLQPCDVLVLGPFELIVTCNREGLNPAFCAINLDVEGTNIIPGQELIPRGDLNFMTDNKHVPDTGNNDGALTGIRFFAAMHVVIFHYGLTAEPFNQGWLQQFMQLGPIAVSFFFVLSGFIMAIAYGNRTWDGALKRRFIWARFARIYPVYLLALLFAVRLYTHYSPFDAETTVTYIGKICMNLFMVQAWLPGLPMAINGPAWSLSVEIFFYVLFPLFFPLIRSWSSKKLWALAGITTLSAVVLAYVILHVWFPDASSKMVREFQIYFPLWHVPSFLIGCALGLLTLRGSFSAWPKWLLTGICLALMVFFACFPQIILNVNRWFYSQFGTGLHGSTMAHNGMLALPFALFLVTLYKGSTVFNKLLGSAWLQFLGHTSYAIYLLQYPVWTLLRFEVFKPLGIVDPTQKFFINVVVLILLSTVVYLFIEKPLRKWLVTKTRSNVMEEKPAVKARSLCLSE